MLTEVGKVKHFNKTVFNKLYLASGLLGSLIFIGEINSNKLISEYGMSVDELIVFQNKFFKEYSKLFFKKEISPDYLLFSIEPNKNFIMLDLIQLLDIYKNNQMLNFPETINIFNYEKIMNVISKIGIELENIN